MLLCVALFASCGLFHHGTKVKAVPGMWSAAAVEIDGDGKDWPSPYPNYDSKALVAYATCNDEKNLYITLETGDELTQIKILKNGLSVSVDTTGKKSTICEINYPLPNENSELFEMPKPDHGQRGTQGSLINRQFGQKVKRGMSEATQYSLEGFGSCTGGYMINQTSPCGIKVKMGYDEYHELIWEAQIPFKVLFNKDTIDASFAGRPISVSFGIKGFKKPENKDETNTANQSMGNGMTGGMNGGMRGGNRGSTGMARQSQDPNQHLYETTRTWKIFSIAGRPGIN